MRHGFYPSISSSINTLQVLMSYDLELLELERTVTNALRRWVVHAYRISCIALLVIGNPLMYIITLLAGNGTNGVLLAVVSCLALVASLSASLCSGWLPSLILL